MRFRTHQHDAAERIGTIDIYNRLRVSATVNDIIVGSNIIRAYQALA